MPKDNSARNELKQSVRNVQYSVNKNDSENSKSSSRIEDNWQASKTTVRERMAVLFNKRMYADVHFKVGKGSFIKRIPAHKLVLSMGSSVFDAMFHGGLAANSDEIDIPDIEPAAFNALLRFFYSDEIIIEAETVLATLYAAKKYAVPALEEHCVKFLQDKLTYHNAFMLLKKARLFDEPKLVAMCLIIIDKYTDGALAAEGFTNVDLDTLCCILSRDSLHIEEAKLFQAIVRWSKAECRRKNLPVTPENQKTVLGTALKLIRFPLMTSNEFALNVAQSGLLTDKEMLSLYSYFLLNPKPSVDFSDTPRNRNSEWFVNLFAQVDRECKYYGLEDRIRFTVNQSIFVSGFGLLGSKDKRKCSAFIKLIDASTNEAIRSCNTTFTCDGSTSFFAVFFNKPVHVLPGASYVATVAIEDNLSYNQLIRYNGKNGMPKVSIGKVTFSFEYLPTQNNYGSYYSRGSPIEAGQIPQILFYTVDNLKKKI